MFSIFKKTATILFLDPLSKQTQPYERGQKTSIVLSPSLYWVQKVTLPITNLREVKKLLPSIFEETLTDGNYSYTAYKEKDGTFLLFAYKDKQILELLTEQGINVSDIHSIHFAQNEFLIQGETLKINETQAILLKDSILIIVPLSWLKDVSILSVYEFNLSKRSIKLQHFKHIIDNKSLYKIWGILLIFIIVLVVEIFISTTKYSTVTKTKEEIFSNYHLQATMFQNRSIRDKYNKIYTRQTNLRAYLSYFLQMKLKEGQKVSFVEYSNKILYITISNVTKNNSSSINSQLDTKKLSFKASFNNNNMRIEIKI